MLLVLTTLIAGVVKLWYGPHHVVERIRPDEEREYTFTRDWQGDKIIHGPFLERFFNDAGYLSLVKLSYFRQGVVVCYANSPKQSLCYTFKVTDKNC